MHPDPAQQRDRNQLDREEARELETAKDRASKGCQIPGQLDRVVRADAVEERACGLPQQARLAAGTLALVGVDLEGKPGSQRREPNRRAALEGSRGAHRHRGDVLGDFPVKVRQIFASRSMA